MVGVAKSACAKGFRSWFILGLCMFPEDSRASRSSRGASRSRPANNSFWNDSSAKSSKPLIVAKLPNVSTVGQLLERLLEEACPLPGSAE